MKKYSFTQQTWAATTQGNMLHAKDFCFYCFDIATILRLAFRVY